MAVIGDDDMIEQSYPQNLPRVLQLGGHGTVFEAGFQLPRRMIMGDDQSHRPDRDGALINLARVNMGVVRQSNRNQRVGL